MLEKYKEFRRVKIKTKISSSHPQRSRNTDYRTAIEWPCGIFQRLKELVPSANKCQE